LRHAFAHFRHFSIEKPFYKQLSEMRRGPETSFQLFTFFPQEAAAANASLKEHGVSADLIMSGPKSFTDIGVSGTPALLLVNSK
jgi:hypothetical protein